jgi:hypothetical protein
MSKELKTPLIQNGSDDEESKVQLDRNRKLSMRSPGARKFNLEEFTRLLDGYQDHLHEELAA